MQLDAYTQQGPLNLLGPLNTPGTPKATRVHKPGTLDLSDTEDL